MTKNMGGMGVATATAQPALLALTPANRIHPLAYRIKDACALSGLGKTTIYRLISEGRLRSHLVAGVRLIRHEDLEALLRD